MPKTKQIADRAFGDTILGLLSLCASINPRTSNQHKTRHGKSYRKVKERPTILINFPCALLIVMAQLSPTEIKIAFNLKRMSVEIILNDFLKITKK